MVTTNSPEHEETLQRREIPLLGIKSRLPLGLYQRAFISEQLLSLMLWPRKADNRTLRNEFARAHLIGVIRAKKRGKKINRTVKTKSTIPLSAQLAWFLEETGPLTESVEVTLARGRTSATQRERLRYRGGLTAGLVALLLFGMRKMVNQRGRLLASVNIASVLANEAAKGSEGDSVGEDESLVLPFYKNISLIKRQWGRFHEVSHLWAAWISLVGTTGTLMPVPTHLEELLARGELIAEGITRHIDQRYARNSRAGKRGKKPRPWRLPSKILLPATKFDVVLDKDTTVSLIQRYFSYFAKGTIGLINADAAMPSVAVND